MVWGKCLVENGGYCGIMEVEGVIKGSYSCFVDKSKIKVS